MSAVEFIMLAAALVGHAAVWIAVLNQLHATALPRWLLGTLHLGAHTMLTLGPVAALVFSGGSLSYWANVAELPLPAAFYVRCCWFFCGVAALVWVVRRWPLRGARPATRITSTRLDLGQQIDEPLWGTGWRSAFAIVPKNQVFDLEINEKELELPGLAPELDGLSIAHLSDFHFEGTIRPAYFEQIVEIANGWDVDFAALTGDIVDVADCLDWIPQTLGRLAPRRNSYFVLGNHDLRVGDEGRLRRMLVEAGLVDLGGRAVRYDGLAQTVEFAGNELPWFTPAGDFRRVEQRRPTEDDEQPRPLRVVLAHCPDQFAWARRFEADLMLAGHTHGGQIRVPVLGAIFMPSRYGTKYDCGVFYKPPTVMHVSRGLSALTPLRLNCPPEMTRIVLRSPVALPNKQRAQATAHQLINALEGIEPSPNDVDVPASG